MLSMSMIFYFGEVGTHRRHLVQVRICFGQYFLRKSILEMKISQILEISGEMGFFSWKKSEKVVFR